jgi:5-formyltetrahydrofolate cyclo-ligase
MKKHIRKRLLNLRDRQPPSQLTEKSDLIIKKLQGMIFFRSAKLICTYISFGSEVSTHKLIKNLLKKEKRVAVPLVKNKNELIFSELKKWEELEPGTYGILEPIREREVGESKIDIFIVPGIAFDEGCYRIGWGKGYYDRVLERASHALRIALAFDFQVLKSIPHKAHDLPVDLILTENRLIKRS